jgi:inner membrane protein
MLGITHAVFGVLFALPFYMGWGEGNIILFGFAMLGSLLPDLDHPKSLISTLNPSIQFLSRHISRVVLHRGIFHTLFAAMMVFIAMTLLALYFDVSLLYPFFLFVGYISHLAADSLNPTGVRWLKPFRESSVSFRVRTGGVGEIAICALIVALLTLFWLWRIGVFEL